jgi:hypothetical protein
LMIVTGVGICGSSSASTGSSSGTCAHSASTQRSGRRRSSRGSPSERRLVPRQRSCRSPRRRSRPGPSCGTCEVGVEHPRRQRLAELERNGGSAGAHDRARDSLRMCRRREQGGRGPHVRRDDMRPSEISLGNELGEEPAHRSWREKVVSAFRRAEPRQVNCEQAGVLGKRGPHRREGIQALRPGTRKQQRRSLEPTLSAYRIRTPSTARNRTCGVSVAGTFI